MLHISSNPARKDALVISRTATSLITVRLKEVLKSQLSHVLRSQAGGGEKGGEVCDLYENDKTFTCKGISPKSEQNAFHVAQRPYRSMFFTAESTSGYRNL